MSTLFHPFTTGPEESPSRGILSSGSRAPWARRGSSSSSSSMRAACAPAAAWAGKEPGPSLGMEASCWMTTGLLRRLIELPSPPLSRHQLKRLDEHRWVLHLWFGSDVWDVKGNPKPGNYGWDNTQDGWHQSTINNGVIIQMLQKYAIVKAIGGVV